MGKEILNIIDRIVNEYDEGEPNELKNIPSQDTETEFTRLDSDLGGDEGEELDDYEEGEDPDPDEDEGEDENMMAAEMVDMTLLDQDNAYQAYFRTVMKKHNIEGIRGLSTEKRSAFFKDVSAGWRSKKKVGESVEINEQDSLQFENYKQYFNYVLEQCEIDDLSILEDEDRAAFYGVVMEAYEVGILYEAYKETFRALMDKEGIKSLKDLSPEKKKSFFNKVDAAWKSKAE